MTTTYSPGGYAISYYEGKRGQFAGLSNQGATCYMNSLLQSLYMSPEFRKRLYQWEHDPDKHCAKEDSIPLQLQLLFGKLQLTKKQACKTTQLTKSFGWDCRESFTQHDVQEFCRVLFDAIEESVNGTLQENMINDLYEGTMVDYVKCLKCLHESKRSDKFLDLSLTVRNPFENVVNNSVEEALANYLKTEKLDGNNKYQCDVCQDKVDALKGLRFSHFPYLLVLQLKRFDLDYTTMQRKKLNDEVRFPQVLNMNEYIEKPDVPTLQQSWSLNPDTVEVKSNEDETEEEPMFNLDFDGMKLETMVTKGHESIISDTEKQPLKMDNICKTKFLERAAEKRRQEKEELIQKYLEEGEFVYELYSIMIHSGGALGGHYYAYIKSFDNNRWYNFNDSSVTEIDESDIEKVYGGAQTQSSSSYYSSYSANAYLLMYRKVSPDNIIDVKDNEVPPSVYQALEEEKEANEKEKQEMTERMSTLQLRVHYNKLDKLIQIKKEQTMREFQEKLISEFKIEDINKEDMRLRAYIQYQDLYQEAYDGEKLDKTISELNIVSYKVFALETKSPEETFEPYDPSLCTVRVHLWNEEYTEIEDKTLDQKTVNPYKIQVSKDAVFRDLMEKFEEKFNIPQDQQRILKKNTMTSMSSVELLSVSTNMERKLSYIRIMDGSVLYLEEKDSISVKSKWETEMERDLNKFTLRFNTPGDPVNSYGQHEFKNSIVIDKKSLLSKLKAAIAKRLDLDENTFVIKRGGQYGSEIKDQTLAITACQLVNYSTLFIEMGVPTNPDEYRLLFFLVDPDAQSLEDNCCYRFKDQFEMAVNDKSKVSEVKAAAVAKANELWPELSLNPDLVRLRERQQEKLSKVLRDDQMIKSVTLYEKKTFALQAIPKGDALEDADLVLVAKMWTPSTWELSDPKEIIISKTAQFHEFGDKLSEEFGIPVENIAATRISYYWNFTRGELMKEHWQKLSGNNYHLSGNPWYISTDGTFFVIKDTTEKVREMTAEEKEKYKAKTHTSSSTTTTTWTSGTSWSRAPERQMKIHVKKKEEEKKEEDTEATEAGDDAPVPAEGETGASPEDSKTTEEATETSETENSSS